MLLGGHPVQPGQCVPGLVQRLGCGSQGQFSQRILHRFLIDNDLDAHIATIIRAYGRQKEAMIGAIRERLLERYGRDRLGG